MRSEALPNAYQGQPLATERWGIVGGARLREYSVAPRVWAAWFARRRPGARCFVVAEDDDAAAESALNELNRDEHCAGYNVAMPWKRLACSLSDWVEETAVRVGTVNTVIRRAGAVRGYNTDGAGLVNGIRGATSLAGARVLLLGAGGGAQTVPYHLLTSGVGRLCVYDVEDGRAAALAHAWSPDFDKRNALCCSVDERALPDVLPETDILINATPCGMKGYSDSSPLTARLLDLITSRLVVADMVYTPELTPLLASAARRGARVVPGTRMLVEQAALSFELAFGPLDRTARKSIRKSGYGALS